MHVDCWLIPIQILNYAVQDDLLRCDQMVSVLFWKRKLFKKSPFQSFLRIIQLQDIFEGVLARVRQLMPLGMTMIPCLAAKSELFKYCKNLKMPLHFSWLIHFSHFSRLASWRERAKGTERGWEKSSFPKYLILKSTDQVTKKMTVVQDKLSILDEGLEKVGRFQEQLICRN